MTKLYFLIVAMIALNIANAQAPSITSFAPGSGSPGTLITIIGTNLNSPTSFTVGGTTAIIVSNTGTNLVGMVMPGTATGNITLTTAYGTTVSERDFTVTAASFPSVQQGDKLVGSGFIGMSQQGFAISVSADGNTAIVGGITDNDVGAAWIFARNENIWTQQGGKLIGTDSTIYGTQGYSVAISADGNTAIVGGLQTDNNNGAAWIYTRTGDTWSQQGGKLTGTGAVGTSGFGSSVSLSADGNTAMIGGSFDNVRLGAAWVFTRTGDTWSQQGNKLVGTGAAGMYSDQGISVDLSADGNTAIVGGYDDNSVGAVWIFIRTGETWTQQGEKLVGSGSAFSTSFGYSVSISADGNTAIVGGPYDNNQLGAVWIFIRTGDTWTQQGNKIIGSGTVGTYIHQGYSVSISADGNTAVFGGPDADNSGAAWVYTRTADIWTQQGDKLVGTGYVGPYVYQGSSVAISADGSTTIVGGRGDNMLTGAAWVYTSYYTAVNSYREDEDIRIYPNPASKKITIESEFFLPNTILSIYNMQGQLLLQRQVQKSKTTIDMMNFTNAVYIIKLCNYDWSIVKRLVKE